MKSISKIRDLFVAHYPLLGFMSLMAFLLLMMWRNPYTEGSVIPNFDPFPDSFHYVIPARNFLAGKGLYLSLQSTPVFSPSVPPLYSVVLIPFYAMVNAPTSFYLANVTLLMFSCVLLYWLLKSLKVHPVLLLVAIFIFVTNPIVSWYVNFAMAEHLVLVLFLVAALLLSIRPSKIQAFAAGLLVFSFFATKYAYWSLGAVLIPMYLWHIWKNKAEDWRVVAFSFVGGIAIGAGGLIAWELLVLDYSRTLNLPTQLLSYLLSVSPGEVKPQEATVMVPFSLSYMQSNLEIYLRSMFGEPVRFLWRPLPLQSLFVGSIAWSGVIITVFKKRMTPLVGFLTVSSLVQILFMSSFYYLDSRYIYNVLPALLILFVLAVQPTLPSKSLLPRDFPGKLVVFLLIATCGYIFVRDVKIWKQQVAVNLRGAETPWNRVFVREFDDFVAGESSDKPVVLVTTMSPFYIDMYAEEDYSLLPISPYSDFFGNPKTDLWGVYPETDIVQIINKRLLKGDSVYLSNYGMNYNRSLTDESWQKIVSSFQVEQRHQGCYGNCDILQLLLPASTP